MSDYAKSTNFTTKDTLPTGNSGKILKGTELDTEFTAIASAVASKANISSPDLLGTPTAPTATAGTSTTQLATTAFVAAALALLYPVGSIYINSGVSTNPATLMGFGTWTEFGAGKVLVGLNSADASFDTLEETGGSKDAVVVSHTHTITDPGHLHGLGHNVTMLSSGSSWGNTGSGSGIITQTSTATTGITNASTGVSGTNANLPPYIVVKMWKRTA